jgi:hypothetical protein
MHLTTVHAARVEPLPIGAPANRWLSVRGRWDRREREARAIDAACDGVRDLLAGGHFATIEARLSRAADRRLDGLFVEIVAGERRAGTKPVMILEERAAGESGAGHRYVLKRAPPALMAAEEAAWDLLRLGGRPGVPARQAVVHVEGAGEVSGLLKPFVDLHARPELPPDTTRWTPLQRAVILIGHAWEHLLDNLDANTSQYARLGPDDLPVNIDWDRAFSREGCSALSRFNKHTPALPNARTFLYADYVEGRVDLPLWLLVREARRLRRLPDDAVRAAFERYARVRYESEAEVEAFLTRAHERRYALEHEMVAFVLSLQRERQAMRAPPRSIAAKAVRLATLAWNRWQLALNSVWRGALGRRCRQALTFVRSRRRGWIG